MRPEERGFSTVYAISVFSSPLAEVMRRYKYKGMYGWAPIFGRLVLGWLYSHDDLARQYTMIVANPTFAGRDPLQHTEGILRAAVAEDLTRRLPIDPTALVKPHDTGRSANNRLPVKSLAATRHAEAVVIQADVRDQRILLFDDICTSGSQIDTVGRKLKAAGALHVDGLVLARTPWSG